MGELALRRGHERRDVRAPRHGATAAYDEQGLLSLY